MNLELPIGEPGWPWPERSFSGRGRDAKARRTRGPRRGSAAEAGGRWSISENALPPGLMPGLEHAAALPRQGCCGKQMREASSQLRRGDAKQAGGAQQNAVERLAKLRDSLQERSSGGVLPQHDPGDPPAPTSCRRRAPGAGARWPAVGIAETYAAEDAPDSPPPIECAPICAPHCLHLDLPFH